MRMIAIGAALLLALGTVAIHAAEPATQPATQPSAAINKTCPITGEAVNSSVTTTYDGKTIAFCCQDCIKDFKKNPDKYMAKMK